MTAYTLRSLIGAVADSTYRDRPRHRLLPVAQAVVGDAHPSLLVARITATTLASRPPVTDPTDTAWRRSLPQLPGPAMRHDLDTRLAMQVEDIRSSMVPVVAPAPVLLYSLNRHVFQEKPPMSCHAPAWRMCPPSTESRTSTWPIASSAPPACQQRPRATVRDADGPVSVDRVIRMPYRLDEWVAAAVM
jgi:hypothetical protein